MGVPLFGDSKPFYFRIWNGLSQKLQGKKSWDKHLDEIYLLQQKRYGAVSCLPLLLLLFPCSSFSLSSLRLFCQQISFEKTLDHCSLSGNLFQGGMFLEFQCYLLSHMGLLNLSWITLSAGLQPQINNMCFFFFVSASLVKLTTKCMSWVLFCFH